MTELGATTLASQRFRREREADWRRLERLIEKAETKSVRRLTDEEILAIPALYRSTLSALSVARETSLDLSVIEYLETLCARAYFFVYGSRTTLQERLSNFLRNDWPCAVQSLWRETLVSTLLMLLGAIVAGALVLQQPEWFHAFVPSELAGGRDPSASTEALRATLEEGGEEGGLSVFATYLFTHNAQVALLAFALGFALCVPTALLVFYNGATLGAFCALFISRGLGPELGGWLLIHGTTELFAIALAGAAGFRIGWAVAFPGGQGRGEAVAAAGRAAGLVMGGVVVMLLVAGLLEGFGRQLINDTGQRYAVAAVAALVWCGYFHWPRRTARS